jgi:RES domain-containing protein
LNALPARLAGWRLETAQHFDNWQTAQGAYLFGGRWSSRGRRVLYTSLDLATAILEVAVHKGLPTLDAVAHTLLQIDVLEPQRVFQVSPTAIPNPSWLRPGTVSPAQQQFGDALLQDHGMLLIPSVVSTHSWNLLIDVGLAAGRFALQHHEAFALDPRLNTRSQPV